ncbi:MAG: glycosyltransferase family 87 protein [Motiliproteus sp.]
MLLSLGFLLGIMLAAKFLYADNLSFIDGELSRGQIVGRDFLNSWTAAKLAGGAAFNDIYDPALLRTHSPDNVNESGVIFNFAYPPHVLTLLLPFRNLGYHSALVVWSVLCVALYIFAATLGSGRYNRVWLLTLAPTTFLNLSFGQNGLLTGALLVGGLRALDQYPRLSGVLFGLLSIKPHLGILIPFALIAGKHWQALFWASLSTLGCFAASVLILGPDAWQAWFQNAPWVYAREYLERGTGLAVMMQVSPFISTRLLVGDLEVSWIIQIITGLIALAAVVAVFTKSKDPVLKLAVLVVATYLVSPYMHNYDMAALSVAIVLLVERGLTKGFVKAEQTILIIAWLTPFFAMSSASSGFAYAPVITMALLLVQCRKALWPNRSAYLRIN